MTERIIQIMRDQVGNPPEWDGTVEGLDSQTKRWMQWSVRKRFVESVLDAARQDESMGHETKRGRK